MLSPSMNESHHYPTDWRHHLTHANYLLGSQWPAKGSLLYLEVVAWTDEVCSLTAEGHRAPGLVIWKDCRSLRSKTLSDD